MPRTRKNTDELLLTTLAYGGTVANAAHSAGMSPRTVHRRLQEPDFLQKLQQLRNETVQRTADMLTTIGLETVKTLIHLLKADCPAGVRLGAVRCALEMGLRFREVVDLKRLTELEQKLALYQPPAAAIDTGAA
jgi:hypothetical protein